YDIKPKTKTLVGAIIDRQHLRQLHIYLFEHMATSQEAVMRSFSPLILQPDRAAFFIWKARGSF
ncbi:MAG: hypothetical protein IKB28_10790, partial [Clostridia bacterium]|nr:hypothetical protein [Clostridia bacterium]